MFGLHVCLGRCLACRGRCACCLYTIVGFLSLCWFLVISTILDDCLVFCVCLGSLLICFVSPFVLLCFNMVGLFTCWGYLRVWLAV